MGNFRDRAREIREQGVAERGNFEPSGVPLRMYQYWTSVSPNVPQRENFCHFWRVVAFWAPLWFLSLKAEDVLTTVRGQVGAVALYVGFLAVIALTTSAELLAAIAFLVPYGAAGLVAGAYMAHNTENVRSSKAARIITAVTAPVSLPFWGLVALVLAMGRGWENLEYETRQNVGKFVVASLLSVGIIAVVVGLTALAFLEGVWFILFIALGIAAVAGLGVAGAFLADYLSGRRQVKRQERRKAIWEALERGEDPFTGDPPGRLSRFFSGVGDFLILAYQVVRVKKWKICPLVDIENEAKSS